MNMKNNLDVLVLERHEHPALMDLTSQECFLQLTAKEQKFALDIFWEAVEELELTTRRVLLEQRKLERRKQMLHSPDSIRPSRLWGASNYIETIVEKEHIPLRDKYEIAYDNACFSSSLRVR